MKRDRNSRGSGSVEEGTRNTEIKRGTDIRNSLGPQEGESSIESSRARSSSDDGVREGDAFGRETPGLSEDME